MPTSLTQLRATSQRLAMLESEVRKVRGQRHLIIATLLDNGKTTEEVAEAAGLAQPAPLRVVS